MIGDTCSPGPKASTVFFTPTENRDFGEVLGEVQSYLSETYASLITQGGEEAKGQMQRLIARYLQDKRISVEGLSPNQLVDALYTEMAEYGFLTKYIFADGIEEIDINSWRDVEVQYSNGKTEKLDEHFNSPEHAANVVRRMIQSAGKVLDNASPVLTSRLAKNIRVAVIKAPVLDEDAGVAASIRIVNPRSLAKEDFVASGTATGEMLDFLAACLRYGVSICVAGATSSGKTTVAGWLLSTIPDRKRIFTIEDGSRELQLVREQNGKVVNSVIHTQTRDSENERQRIDQIALLDIALRFNPDIICVGEMRGPEANAAQEAARVGVAVLTTIHSNSSEGTYRRMVSLCKRAVDTPDDTLMGYVTEAYPIVVYCRQLENKQRRITNISECEILPDGKRKLRSLYEYQITENRLEGDRFVVEGHHRKSDEMSQGLRRRFIENGMSHGEIEQFLSREEENQP
jgi:pilus assembly protein CpaF